MASIAWWRIINAAAFIGGNYLAKALTDDSGNAALAEKIRHDKALENNQADNEKLQTDRTELLDWTAVQYPFVKKIKRDTAFKIPTKHWPSTIKHTEQR